MDVLTQTPLDAAEQDAMLEQSGDDGVQVVDADCTHLSPNGNAIFVVPSRHSTLMKSFLVSSEILKLTSKVFIALFEGSMREAEELKNGNKPRIELFEDDADAMEVILRVLHHDTLSIRKDWDLDLLASISVHCDKYDCYEILNPWVMKWLLSVQSSDNAPADYGLKLLISFILRAPEQFSRAFAQASTLFIPDFVPMWSEHALLQLLPDTIACELASRIRDISRSIRERIEKVEGNLRRQGPMHLMPYMECPLCGRKHPQDAKKCHPCSNTQLRQRFCSEETRVADFILALRQVWLSGVDDDFHSLSINDLVTRIASVSRDSKHVCAADVSCPLKKELHDLSRACHEIRDNAKGMSLESAQRGGADEIP